MKWRYYAEREFPRVIRDLDIPCATTVHATGMSRCPRHDQPLGDTTRMCLACHDEAWDEVGRRYAAQGRQVDRQPEPQEEEPQMTISSTELADRELLPAVIDEPASAPITLFGTSDPRTALERMSEVASVLVDVINDRRLYANISGSKHITAEGWTTLGGMLGVVPVVVWTKPNETNDGYVARVEARTLDGRVVGGAESECSRAERRWKNAEPYAIRSMAQTRAIGRALRAPLGQIVVLAGYEPSPAEEMPAIDAKSEPDAATSRGPIPEAIRPTDDQVAELNRLLTELKTVSPDVDWPVRAREIAGVPGDMLTATTMEILLGKLDDELEEAA